MKNMRLWQKTYLFTMALCILALTSGFIYIGLQTQKQALQNEVDSCKSEEAFLSQSISRDLLAIENLPNLRVPKLLEAYSQYWEQQGILYEIWEGEMQLATNLPNVHGERPELSVVAGTQSWIQRTVEGTPYIFVSSSISAPESEYVFVYARSLQPLHDSWAAMRSSLVTGALLVILFLAVVLFFVLRSISVPLARLAKTADIFADGDLTARVPEGGSYEVSSLANSFNNMATATQQNINELADAAEQNRRMAANLSHEIRTPLTAIRGYAEYMHLADLTDEEKDISLQYIIEESARLQKISQRMLQIFSLQQTDVKNETADLVEIIERVLHTVGPIAKSKAILLTNYLPQKAMIPGDTLLLESLIANLGENAIKATGAGGEVEIKVEEEDTGFLLEVKDTGRGMDAEELAAIGEPFYRPDKSRSRAEGGAGLGVALCKQIAALHGTSLEYVSSPGNGTTVQVKFTTL